ncbi:MAG: carboxypeptidase-like regulatory domain-containing protein [Kofleriaceae bacterium]
MRLAWSLVLLTAACSSSHDAAPDAGAGDTPLADAAAPATTFAYKPAWSGVVSVDVVGAAVGATGAWTTLASLTDDGSGTFTGTATLAAGAYDYLFHVTGDAAAGAKAATLARYAIDPASADFEPCPMDSPSYSAEMNPCSKLAVPQGSAPVLYHVTGRVVVAGAPAADFLVLVERDETATHHFFANRATTAADGTYDFAVASGSYRIQVQHPAYESKTDKQLQPKTLGQLRRDISSGFPVAAAAAVPDAEMGYASYAAFAPLTSGTLPTTFSFPTGMATHLDIYGAGVEIGDPWFSSPVANAGTATFDGTFNTPKAMDPKVVAGTAYWWGLELPHPATSGGIGWTQQTMVFPITWAVAPN